MEARVVSENSAVPYAFIGSRRFAWLVNLGDCFVGGANKGLDIYVGPIRDGQ